MSLTISDVRTALADVLGQIPDWRVTPYVGTQVNPPVLKVSRPAFDPRMVFGQSKAAHKFVVTAYVTIGAAEQGEQLLDTLCELTGATSLIAVVQNGALWSVDVDYCAVTNVGEVTAAEIAGAEYLVCPFEIEVVW